MQSMPRCLLNNRTTQIPPSNFSNIVAGRNEIVGRFGRARGQRLALHHASAKFERQTFTEPRKFASKRSKKRSLIQLGSKKTPWILRLMPRFSPCDAKLWESQKLETFNLLALTLAKKSKFVRMALFCSTVTVEQSTYKIEERERKCLTLHPVTFKEKTPKRRKKIKKISF